MTFVRCPNCQQAYQVRRAVEYAEPFLCSVCGCHFNYGGASEPRPGSVEETLRLPGRMKVLNRASSRMPTIRPPAELREIAFDPDCDARRLTARDLTTDPDIPQDDMNLPLDEGEGLLWRGLARTGLSDTEEWIFLTDRRVLYFGEGGPFEYRLEALKDVRTDWRDHEGNLSLELFSGETVTFTGEEIWRPSMYLNYVWSRPFRMHFWTND